ncbi:bifunctional 5,10-methylenetetrahydrofolate dehydrogenase/5,10-methenyltetrahydrofolate cyclohydrolase [Leptolyngbya sp. 7M]|uniref:bifunctional 5,10-methylenetetrahydrofolate dehydrogenase/5,10-methenyltetrahydrofolate cyclohydrolase n=1 Tax=Leptolyngbya sp. 7M TaxID=2812896 RepID=UPI001B8BC3DD|nr:bifunctional 5,10-methylenetetrahydrofolate dehydrogenase/5,10-methenyltetrahydrofolate cyclohydrolase [Leptolyngbya sp. 7M]QYO65460.1 bifunctional 5,10-methylenetetrahydrofolate dehydrogenase/5,10-methenyltetrahydrofolate cyclohydrolase [Leptolyngbya sp. 7M]
MAAKILSGRQIADAIKAEIAGEVRELRTAKNIIPALTAVRVGDDAASAVYVANKVSTCEELGIISEHRHLPTQTSELQLLDIVNELNRAPDIDGILVQLPLPKHIDEARILDAIDPNKDVDGFHPINVGRLSQGRQSLVPCTPAGVIQILKRSGVEIAGKNAAVIGRSNIVGKPMAALLLQENATVTICHSRTHELSSITSKADIIVAAIGRPGFVTADHIREGAVVIDVGINSVSDPTRLSEFFEGDELEKRLTAIEKRGATLVGDVCHKDAMNKAGVFTPVPGGVGLLTIAMLMRNTVDAAKARRDI